MQLDYIIAIDAIGLYLSEYWKFANYVALLDDNRWCETHLALEPQEVGGLDVHFFNGKLLYKIFAAGIT